MVGGSTLLRGNEVFDWSWHGAALAASFPKGILYYVSLYCFIITVVNSASVLDHQILSKMAATADALTMWALLFPPALGVLWALHQTWRISKIRLDGHLGGENKRLTDPLYIEVRCSLVYHYCLVINRIHRFSAHQDCADRLLKIIERVDVFLGAGG